MKDPIERQAAIDALEERLRANGYGNVALVSELNRSIGYIMRLPSAQPEQTDCEYCHEDSDGYVLSIEKNSHAYLVRRGRTMKLRVGFKGEYRECDILFCPMCGRELKHG